MMVNICDREVENGPPMSYDTDDQRENKVNHSRKSRHYRQSHRSTAYRFRSFLRSLSILYHAPRDCHMRRVAAA